jgi:hypothetical protein
MDYALTFLFGLATGVAGHAIIVSRLEKAVSDVKADIARIEAAVKAKL